MIHACPISTFPGLNQYSRISASPQVRRGEWEKAASVPCLAVAALGSRLVPAAVEDIADTGEPAGDRPSCTVVGRSCSAWRFAVVIVEAEVRRNEILQATRQWTRHRRR